MKKKASFRPPQKAVKKPPQKNLNTSVAAPHPDEVNRLVAFCNQQQHAEAQALAQSLIQRFPKYGLAWKVLGIVFQHQGKLNESLHAKQMAVDLLPNDASALNNLGNTYQHLNRLEEAEKYLRLAIKIAPDFHMAYNNLGLVLEKQNRLEEAETEYQKALALQPEYAVAHYNYGNTLQKMDLIEEAGKSYAKALALQPHYKEALNNYGGILHKLEDYEGAVASYKKALEINQDYADVLGNIGLSLEKLDRFAESDAYYRRALTFKPNDPETHNNYALLLLITGRWREGWAEHQWFYHPENPNKAKPTNPEIPVKPWRGEPIQGKSILIYPEQGLGDMIQFMRYSQLLKEHGATVYLAVAKPLREICKTNPWVEKVLARDELSDVHFDFWTFPLQLPYWFKTTVDTVPVSVPYLFINAQKSAWWKIWLDKQIPLHHKKVGLVWAGNPKQPNDKKRSLALNQFAGFANLPNITFISLQLGEKAQQELKNAPEGLNILDGGRFIEDFTDSAGLLENLDLLITVCSAPAHLAGALNLPVWTMISKPFDWRWLLNRSDTVWYKSMRLFRQTTNGDWNPVLEEVKNALTQL